MNRLISSIRFTANAFALLLLLLSTSALRADEGAKLTHRLAGGGRLNLPMHFEPTIDGELVSHAGRYHVQVGRGGETRLSSPGHEPIKISLAGASSTQPKGEFLLPGTTNYLMGNNQTKWRHGVKQFQRVRVDNVYRGVDLLYYGKSDRDGSAEDLEHDYVVAAGAASEQIRMRVEGATVHIDDASGDLLLHDADAATELARLRRPVAYQTKADGSREMVNARYQRNNDGSISFALGSYDHARSLTIDPVITYSTYFGGSNFDEINDIKTDGAGNIYLLVETNSIDLPVRSQIKGACGGGCGPGNTSASTNSQFDFDFYVAKLDPTGKTLLFSTYIGGSASDIAGSFALAADGTIYIVGASKSTDFPLKNSYLSTPAPPDGNNPTNRTTLTKLSADGSVILYSTLIGGGLMTTRLEGAYGKQSAAPGTVTVGANGIAYILGFAETSDPNSGFGDFLDYKGAGSFKAALGSYIAKFDTTKSGEESLLFAMPYGQPGDREGDAFSSIAVDSKGNLWAYGSVNSYASITPTPDALQPICDGGAECGNAILVELDPSGNQTYATFLGGTRNSGGGPGIETSTNIVIDSTDDIYLSGLTESVDFPTKNPAYATQNGSGATTYLTKLAPGGKSILYSTYAYENPPVVAATANGIAALVGFSTAGFLPVVNGTTSAPRSNDATYQVFDTTKSGPSSLLISSYLGSTGGTYAFAATFDSQENLLLGGYTLATDLPVVDAYQGTCNANCLPGNYIPDGFLSRIQLGLSTGSVTLTPAKQTFVSTAAGATSAVLTSTLTNTTSDTFLFNSSLVSTDFKESDTCNGMVLAGGNCVLSFTFTPQTTGVLTSIFTLTSTSSQTSTLSVALSGTSTIPTPPATLAPTSLNFGDVTVGSASPVQIADLTNSGSASFQVSSVTQSNPAIIVHTSFCARAVMPGSYCQLEVTFKPTATGPFSGTVVIKYYLGDGSTPSQNFTSTLTITATAVAPNITLTPASFDFGSTVDALTTPLHTFTVTNSGGDTVSLSQITIAGPFQIVNGATCIYQAKLPAGQSCTIPVVFAPVSPGANVGTLYVSYTAGGGAITKASQLTGTGVVPTVTLTPANYNFGNLTVGASSGPVSFELTNTSGVSLTLSDVSITGSGFHLLAKAGTLAPGGSTKFEVAFLPTSAGAVTGTLTAITSAGTLIARLTGTGTAPTATLTPANYNFGNLTVGASSGPVSFELTNTSGVSLTLSDVSITGSGFHLLAKAGTLAPGGSTKFEVAFLPTSAGAVTGTLTAITSAGTLIARLTGTGTAPTATLTPANYNFGNLTVGASSGPVSFELTNTSGVSLTLSDVSITGSGFHLLAKAGTLAPGGSTKFEVAFLPTSAGAVTGTLTAITSAGTLIARLTGTGTAPTATLTPANYNFGNLTVGASSGPVSFELTNTSGVSLALSDVSITGSGFHLLAKAGTLAPGGSTKFEVAFLPTSAGAVTGTLTAITSAGTLIARLTGTGTAPTATLTPANYNFGNLTVGASSGPVSFELTNTSGVSLALSDVSITGSGFHLLAKAGTLAPGGSTKFEVAFLPTSAGAVTGTLTAITSAGTLIARLTGTGTAPTATLTPTNYNFGRVTTGTSLEQIFTLTSTSSTPLHVTNYSLTGPGFAYPGLDGTNPCSLTQPNVCVFKIIFAPKVTGAAMGTFTVTDDAGTQTAALTGTGVAPTGPPAEIDFSNGFTAGILALGAPATVTGGVLQLTSGPSSQASSAFFPTPVSATSFTTDVTFQLLDPTAEGITYTIQGNGPNAVGRGGGGLGYQGIAKSVALKFDLKDTAGEGIDSTGVYINGAAPTVPAIPLTSSVIDLHSGHAFALHLDYDGALISASLTDTVSKAVWKAQEKMDIPGIVGGNIAYVGFTAGSGTAAPRPNAAASERSVPAAISAPATSQETTATSKILSWTYTALSSKGTVQTITLPELAVQTYGAAPIHLSATATSGLPVSYVVTGPAAVSGSTLTITGAGTVTLTATQTGNAVFAAAQPVTQSFTVAKASLTVKADNLSRAVGAANPKLTYTVLGLVESDTSSVISGSATLATSAISISPAGNYPITFATEGLNAANYNLAYVAGNMTVTEAGSQCTLVDYSRGFTSAGLMLNGSSKILNGLLQLTDGKQFESASAYFSNPLPTTSFTTDITFQLIDPGADGITFVVQAAGLHALGEAGGGLGYAGIQKSVALKLDLHNNAGEGTNSTGIYINGAFPGEPSLSLDGSNIDLHSGHVFQAHLSYDGQGAVFNLTDTTTGIVFQKLFPGNIMDGLGVSSAYFGFTAATGAGTAMQNILAWTYSGGNGCPVK